GSKQYLPYRSCIDGLAQLISMRSNHAIHQCMATSVVEKIGAEDRARSCSTKSLWIVRRVARLICRYYRLGIYFHPCHLITGSADILDGRLHKLLTVRDAGVRQWERSSRLTLFIEDNPLEILL